MSGIVEPAGPILNEFEVSVEFLAALVLALGSCDCDPVGQDSDEGDDDRTGGVQGSHRLSPHLVSQSRR